MPPAPPQYVPTPPGHYNNPLENMVAAAARLAALPVDGDSPTAIETRRVRELLQTALAQQEAYSYSRDRIHSTLVRARARVTAGTWSQQAAQVTSDAMTRPLAMARLIMEPFTQQTKRGKRRSKCRN